jgi:hypothetical protein
MPDFQMGLDLLPFTSLVWRVDRFDQGGARNMDMTLPNIFTENFWCAGYEHFGHHQRIYVMKRILSGAARAVLSTC